MEHKNFSVGIFEHYLVFVTAKNTLNILVILLGLNRGNLVEFLKKILKIYLNQIAILRQIL